MSSSVIRAKAPAKLNLFLHITGRRDDGYHLLQSLFVPIALYDSLVFSQNALAQVRRISTIAEIPEDDDLVVKAARLLRAHVCRPELGVDIELHKVIPSGAGLGGGSSDAATTLLALNQLWDLRLTKEELLPLALQLGADVPFFLYAKPAIVEGIGERITQLSEDLGKRLNKVHYVLFVPKLAIPTPSIFKDPHLKRDSGQLSVSDLEFVLGDSKQPWHYGRNDLESVACAQHPNLEVMRQFLTDLGFEVRMSGAGSVFFAAYDTQAAAKAAQGLVEAAFQTLGADHPLKLLQLRCVVVDGISS